MAANVLVLFRFQQNLQFTQKKNPLILSALQKTDKIEFQDKVDYYWFIQNRELWDKTSFICNFT